MSHELLMPKLGLTMTEGVLLEWKVAPGDRFAKGDILFVVETDKAANEIEAEEDGRFAERLVQEGDTVPVGEPVGRLAGAVGDMNAIGMGKATHVTASPAAPVDKDAPLPAEPLPQLDASSVRIVATPLARRIARDGGIDLASLSGSGPNGRIKAADVQRAMAAQTCADAKPPAPEAAEPRRDEGPVGGGSPTGSRSRPTTIQAAMARRLAAVKQGVPHFYLSTEVEVSALLDLRAALNADADLPRLTLTHFLLAAVGRALVDFPNINRIWDEGEIVTFATTAVSMAVETEGGLYVPVVPDCGTNSLDHIAKSARMMIDKARHGRLSTAEMSGAAITVSNAGMHDVTWLTSIINPGQSSIIGVGSVRELFRPDREGRPTLKREMGVVFSGDHRVHTGVEGLAFLNKVKSNLENPTRLLRHG